MISPSSDPVADAARYDDECAGWEAKTPVCDICGEHITDDYFYKIGDTVFHLDCAERYSVERFVETQAYGY